MFLLFIIPKASVSSLLPSHPLQPLLGPDHRLHQRLCRLLLHRHSPPVPRGVRLDTRAVALPACRNGVLRQTAADERGHRPVQDEDVGPERLQGRLGPDGDVRRAHLLIFPHLNTICCEDIKAVITKELF